MRFSIQTYSMHATRPAAFCLCIQDGSVFADFDLTLDKRVRLIRISFDGYGCCTPPVPVEPLSTEDSASILLAVESSEFELYNSAEILANYFLGISSVIWKDALEEYSLI